MSNRGIIIQRAVLNGESLYNFREKSISFRGKSVIMVIEDLATGVRSLIKVVIIDFYDDSLICEDDRIINYREIKSIFDNQSIAIYVDRS